MIKVILSKILDSLMFYEIEENLIIKFLPILESSCRNYVPLSIVMLLCIIANYSIKVSLTPHAFQLFLRWALWARESGSVGRCQGRRWCTTSMGNQPRWKAKFKRMVECSHQFLLGTTAGTMNITRREKCPRQETSASCKPRQHNLYIIGRFCLSVTKKWPNFFSLPNYFW